MYLVLGNLLITRLKTILDSNHLYIYLLIVLSLFLFIKLLIREDKSIYNSNDSSFTLVVKEYKFSEDKLSLELTGKENLIGTYYVRNNKELNYLKDNIKYGVTLKVLGSLKNINNNTIPNTFNYKKYPYY